MEDVETGAQADLPKRFPCILMMQGRRTIWQHLPGGNPKWRGFGCREGGKNWISSMTLCRMPLKTRCRFTVRRRWWRPVLHSLRVKKASRRRSQWHSILWRYTLGRTSTGCSTFSCRSSYIRVQECNKKVVGPLSMDVFGHYEQKTLGSTVDISREIWFLNSRQATTHFSNLPSILKFHYKTCIDHLYVIRPAPLPSHDAAWTPSTCSSC